MSRTFMWFVLIVSLASCGTVRDSDLSGRLRESSPSIPVQALKKEELNLEDVLAVADAMNPELGAAKKGIDISNALAHDAALYPNPFIGSTLEDYNRTAGFGESKRTIRAGIPIVIGGRIGAKVAAAETERDIAVLDFLWKRREILTDAKKAFYEILAARQRREIAQQSLEFAKQFHELTEERFKLQTIPEMEYLKAAVNLAKAEIDLKTADKELAITTKRLQTLLGDTDFKFKGQLSEKFVQPGFDALRGELSGTQPLLERATKQRELAEREIELLKSERLSDIEFEAAVGRENDDGIIEGGIVIPLPLINRNQAKIAAAECRRQQAALQIQATRNQLVAALAEAYGNFTNAQDRVTTYAGSILPKAQTALEQTNEGYRQGKFSQLDVLDAQRTLADARSAHLAALLDLNSSAAELEKIAGSRVEATK